MEDAEPKKDKELVAWQFADHLLKHVNEKLARINFYIMTDMYEQAFEELRQIFVMVNWEILREYEKEYTRLVSAGDEINRRILEYSLLGQRRTNKMILLKMTKLKYELKECIYDYYMHLMEMMDKLNMLFPKTKQDMRLAIYK